MCVLSWLASSGKQSELHVLKHCDNTEVWFQLIIITLMMFMMSTPGVQEALHILMNNVSIE